MLVVAGTIPGGRGVDGVRRRRARGPVPAPTGAQARSLTPARHRSDPRAAHPPAQASARRAAHTHVEGRHDRSACCASSRDAAVQRWSCTRSTATCSAGISTRRRERTFRVIERMLAHATDRLIAVSDEVRDDLVRFRVAPSAKFVGDPLRLRPRRARAPRRFDPRAQARGGRRGRTRLRDRLGRTADRRSSGRSTSCALRPTSMEASSCWPATVSCAASSRR